MRWACLHMLSALALVEHMSARPCGIGHARSFLPPAAPVGCLRLRGGFFKLPSSAAAPRGETATAEDFEDAEDGPTPAADKAGAGLGAGAGAGAGQEAGAGAAAQQLTVQQHVAEYALAGSLDGLRTGLGQSVGGQVNVFVSTALQSAAKVISLAFASAVCAYRERQVSPVESCQLVVRVSENALT